MKHKKTAPKQKTKEIHSTKNKTSIKNCLAGKWRIIEMPNFDQKDIDMETKANITIERGGSGEFQFLLVHDDISGEFSHTPSGTLFDFTWLGNDECDKASGDGWICSLNGTKAEGKICFHCSDTYQFRARKISTSKKGE